MLRGMNKEDLFLDDLDRKKFLDRLGHMIETTPCTVYAFALMNNHVHLLLRSGAIGVSAVMRKLLTWYAGYFNRRHHRCGHLFQNRYKSILCEEEPYFLELVATSISTRSGRGWLLTLRDWMAIHGQDITILWGRNPPRR
jgi:putative transposase